jgi:hypothetical protein
MTCERFWVIGGDFSSMAFEALRNGSGRIEGPFPTREHAHSVWKRLSQDSSSSATTRYSIAVERMVGAC